MKTLKNINGNKADQVFEMTGFNYDITEMDNGDGTIDITFDSPEDSKRFETFYNEI